VNNLREHMTNQLEKEFRALCRALYDLQIAYIFKVPEEMQQTPCDFFGHTTTGIAVFVECKQVNRSALPIGTSNGIAGHQWIALKQAHQCGCYSFLVWRRGEETALVPFSVCLEAAVDRKSIAWSDVARLAQRPLQTALIEALEGE